MPTVSPICAGADLVVEESPLRDPALAARSAGVPKINHAIKRAPNPTTARANARSGPVSRGVGELLVDRPTGSICGLGRSEIGCGGRGAVTNRTFRQAEHLTRPVGEISTVRHAGHVTRTFSACLTVSYRQTKTIALNLGSRDSTLKSFGRSAGVESPLRPTDRLARDRNDALPRPCASKLPAVGRPLLLPQFNHDDCERRKSLQRARRRLAESSIASQQAREPTCGCGSHQISVRELFPFLARRSTAIDAELRQDFENANVYVRVKQPHRAYPPARRQPRAPPGSRRPEHRPRTLR